jgi:DNA-binding GntR family transcriptional regulator
MKDAQEVAELESGDAERSLTDRVYRSIKEDILAARVGSKPMVEAAMARKYGVSKTPVREALRQLAHEGLVIVLPRKGYLVRPMGVSDIVEVMDLRRIVEPPLAAAAARERLLNGSVATPPTLESLLLSLRVHEFIAEIAGNSRAATLVRSLLDEATRIPWLAPGLRIYPEQGEHDDLLADISRGDADGAERAMAAHLDAVKASTLLALGAH